MPYQAIKNGAVYELEHITHIGESPNGLQEFFVVTPDSDFLVMDETKKVLASGDDALDYLEQINPPVEIDVEHIRGNIAQFSSMNETEKMLILGNRVLEEFETVYESLEGMPVVTLGDDFEQSFAEFFSLQEAERERLMEERPKEEVSASSPVF